MGSAGHIVLVTFVAIAVPDPNIDWKTVQKDRSKFCNLGHFLAQGRLMAHVDFHPLFIR